MHWPHLVTRQWAPGGSSGRGVRGCVIDSGIDAGHPRVGVVDGAVMVELDEENAPDAEPQNISGQSQEGLDIEGVAIQGGAESCAGRPCGRRAKR